MFSASIDNGLQISMEIRHLNKANLRINKAKSQATSPHQATETAAVRPISSFNSGKLEYIDPGQHGAIAQLINNKYQLQKQKQSKRLFIGKQLQAILQKSYKFTEFQRLPRSIKNLIRFDRNIKSAEITQFTEFDSEEHEIHFKDFEFDGGKFRAVFESWGELKDVQMKAGLNNFVSLSEGFEIREKIFDLFHKFRQRLLLRKRQRDRLRAKKLKAENERNKERESIQTS